MEAILTGEPIPAERAYQLGLVNRLVRTRSAPSTAALALAGQIDPAAPLAVWECRHVVWPAAAGGEDEDVLRELTEAAMSDGRAVGGPRGRAAPRLHREASARVDRPLSVARRLSDP